MAVGEEIKAAVAQVLTDVDAATNRVAALILALTGQITNSMTNEQVAEIKAGLTAAADRAKAIAADPVVPVPPEPPVFAGAFKRK